MQFTGPRHSTMDPAQIEMIDRQRIKVPRQRREANGTWSSLTKVKHVTGSYTWLAAKNLTTGKLADKNLSSRSSICFFLSSSLFFSFLSSLLFSLSLSLFLSPLSLSLCVFFSPLLSFFSFLSSLVFSLSLSPSLSLITLVGKL